MVGEGCAGPTIGFHLFGCGAVGLADGVLCSFTGTRSAYLGPDDPATVDNLARLDAHERALQRPLRWRAILLGLAGGNGSITPQLLQRGGNNVEIPDRGGGRLILGRPKRPTSVLPSAKFGGLMGAPSMGQFYNKIEKGLVRMVRMIAGRPGYQRTDASADYGMIIKTANQRQLCCA